MRQISSSQGVSPVIGILLLLGLTIALFALASTIFFGTIDSSANPASDVEVTHEIEEDSGPGASAGEDEANVDVRILRNENVDGFTVNVEESGSTTGDGTEFSDTDSGATENVAFELDDDEDYTVVVLAHVGTETFVLKTYDIPDDY